MLVLVEPCSTRAPCSKIEGSVAAGGCGAGISTCTGATDGSAVAACCTVGLAVVAAVVCMCMPANETVTDANHSAGVVVVGVGARSAQHGRCDRKRH
eukprot:10785-Heterococcus_DN1.PRE.1